MFMLKNREFAMTVDTSNLACGLNGAAYFVEMDKDGGLSHEGLFNNSDDFSVIKILHSIRGRNYKFFSKRAARDKFFKKI